MAIQVSYKAPNGAIHPIAYVRIVRLEIDHRREVMEIQYSIYNSEVNRIEGKRPLDMEVGSVGQIDADNRNEILDDDPEGRRPIAGNYDRYFGEDVLALTGNTPTSQAYVFMKDTLDLVDGGIDLL